MLWDGNGVIIVTRNDPVYQSVDIVRTVYQFRTIRCTGHFRSTTMQDSPPHVIFHAFGSEGSHRCRSEKPGVPIFDSEGSFEVQLCNDLNPVLFPLIMHQKDVIIVDPKDVVYLSVRTSNWYRSNKQTIFDSPGHFEVQL